MKHFFVDTNVLIDFLTHREGFGQAAADLFEASVRGKATLYVASLSFSHIYHVLRKNNSTAALTNRLTLLSELVTIISVDALTVELALLADFSDFEDALQYFAAVSVPEISAIVTRDDSGFVMGELSVLTPVEALATVE